MRGKRSRSSSEICTCNWRPTRSPRSNSRRARKSCWTGWMRSRPAPARARTTRNSRPKKTNSIAKTRKPRPMSHRANEPLRRPSFLDQPSLRLLLFGGKGGVGKTTCACATALRLAGERRDESFLLVSTDPAHSVQDSLAGLCPPANLAVLELDAQQCLEEFRRENGNKLHAIAAAGTFLDDEDISRFLSLSLPGLDELMAFLKIVDWVENGTYASIVVDTAPSGHALRLLGMPRLIRKWLSVLDALLAKRR